MTLGMVLVCNKEVVFLLQRNGHAWAIILPLERFIGFWCPIGDVGPINICGA
jgi:hypothetical protein